MWFFSSSHSLGTSWLSSRRSRWRLRVSCQTRSLCSLTFLHFLYRLVEKFKKKLLQVFCKSVWICCYYWCRFLPSLNVSIHLFLCTCKKVFTLYLWLQHHLQWRAENFRSVWSDLKTVTFLILTYETTTNVIFMLCFPSFHLWLKIF